MGVMFDICVLFDTVAIYLAYSEELLKIKELLLKVTEDGYTIIDEENGDQVRTAVEWVSIDMFYAHLTDTLLN